MLKQTSPTARKAATAPTKSAKEPTAKAAAANGRASPTITESEFLDYVQSLEKGSDILRKSRNIIFRKLAAKPLDEEVLKVLRELVTLKTYDVVKRCWSEVRKENAPEKTDAEKVEAES